MEQTETTITEQPSEYTVSTGTVQLFKVRHKSGMYWADITIDENPKGGRIQIASDYGNWQNYWGAAGGSFKKFLAQLDIHYAAGKFNADRWFDHDETISSWKKAILQQRHEEIIGEIKARLIFDEIVELEDYNHESEFIIECGQKQEIQKHFNYCPELSYSLQPGFKMFWKNVWPVFINAIKDKPTVMLVEDEKQFWPFECECGHRGSSEELFGGHALADSGDYGDVYCPVCGKVDPETGDNDIISDQEIYIKKLRLMLAKVNRNVNEYLHWNKDRKPQDLSFFDFGDFTKQDHVELNNLLRIVPPIK